MNNSLLYLITIGAFLIWIVRNIFFWVALWQRREYRLDRFMAELSETDSGKSLLFSKTAFLKWILLFGYGFVVYDNSTIIIYHAVVAAVFIFDALKTIREIFIRR